MPAFLRNIVAGAAEIALRGLAIGSPIFPHSWAPADSVGKVPPAAADVNYRADPEFAGWVKIRSVSAWRGSSKAGVGIMDEPRMGELRIDEPRVQC